MTEKRYAADAWSSVDFEIRTEGDGMTFSGYAAVFNSDSEPMLGWGVEQIAPGAFTKSLKDAAAGSRNIKMFLNHNSDLVLASSKAGTLRLNEDEKGLHVAADLPDTSTGRDLSVLMQRGDVSTMSFGFKPVKFHPRNDGVDGTIHTEVGLWEVSPVTSWPAYPATSAFVRHLAELVDVEEEPLADSLRILLEQDAPLTIEQRDVLLVAINKRTEHALIAPETARMQSTLSDHERELAETAKRLGLVA